jgi:hypothetical protein
MSDRVITSIRFRSPVNVGSVDHNEWSLGNPMSSSLASRIKPRFADAAKGERVGDIVLEYRAGVDNYDVVVPRSNVVQYIHAVAVPKDVKK